ncbi:MAG: hypothetical protein IJK05_02570 [Bacteroidales bacterium]|nr:hypothetical protein [Bacteroidales bacterium]
MRNLFLMILALALSLTAFCQNSLPEIYVEGDSHHVQGIAYDRDAGRMYFSFTTSFVVTDMAGKVLGSVGHIQGHLGAMVFDPGSRKVYASLECKDDVIGRGLSDFAKGRSMFYVAIIDVDKVTSVGMDSEDNEAFKIVCVKEATKDYHLKGFGPAGEEFEHFYGCSGIDGVAIAPKLGKKGGKNYLYVAYGIYGDNSRNDNDSQVLLRYDLEKFGRHAGKVRFGEFYSEGPAKPLDKYFVYTGNTNWGTQNMAYDKASGKMFLFVYKGSKERFTNYDAFSFDVSSRPVKRGLLGVLYDRSRHPVVGSWEDPVTGIFFKYGSTGVSPLGDGRFYFSQNGKSPQTGKQYCRARVYRWNGETFVPED